jgi:hypothetical protein
LAACAKSNKTNKPINTRDLETRPSVHCQRISRKGMESEGDSGSLDSEMRPAAVRAPHQSQTERPGIYSRAFR